MRLLIDDGMQINVGTGIGKYTLNLYRALKNNGVEVDLLNYQISDCSRIMKRIKYLKYINSDEFIRLSENYDYVLFTNFVIPFRENRKTLYAVTIHDLVAYLYPDTLPLWYRYYSQFVIQNSVKRADVIFTDSNSVANEIINKFHISKERLYPIWLGVNYNIQALDVNKGYEDSTLNVLDNTPFFLFVSTVEKRKNVGMVIDAFMELKKKCSASVNHKLVIAGRPGFGYQEFVEKVNKSSFAKDVIFTGYISDNDCNLLYNRALAFIFPTVYEGFGFAQVECMSCHLPIILSDIPVNKEVSRDYGEYFSLNNIDTLINAMEKFLNGDYDYIKKDLLADQYICDFQWDNIAKKYIDVLKKCKETKFNRM